MKKYNSSKIAKAINNFVNIPLTYNQWRVVLKGAGCPTSPTFWKEFQIAYVDKLNNTEWILFHPVTEGGIDRIFDENEF